MNSSKSLNTNKSVTALLIWCRNASGSFMNLLCVDRVYHLPQLACISSSLRVDEIKHQYPQRNVQSPFRLDMSTYIYMYISTVQYFTSRNSVNIVVIILFLYRILILLCLISTKLFVCRRKCYAVFIWIEDKAGSFS
jgi:hypothetical protein